MVKYTGRGLVVKRPGGLSKVQMLDLVLGVGVLFLSSKPYIDTEDMTGRRSHRTMEMIPALFW